MRDRTLSLSAHSNVLCTLDRSCPDGPTAFFYNAGHKVDGKLTKTQTTHILWLAALCRTDDARPARLGPSTVTNQDKKSSELSVNLPSNECEGLGSPLPGKLKSFKPGMGTSCTAFEEVILHLSMSGLRCDCAVAKLTVRYSLPQTAKRLQTPYLTFLIPG